MKRWMKTLAIGGVALLIGLTTSTAMAQQGGAGRGDRGNRPAFDPEQMRQRMMERTRERLGVKDDAEWKVIEERLTKVMEARRDVGFGGMGMGMFARGPGQRGGQQGDQAQERRNRFFGSPMPEAEALRNAIESNAPAAEVKQKLEAYRNAVKERRAKLAQAEKELKAVLTVRQEAQLVLDGMLSAE